MLETMTLYAIERTRHYNAPLSNRIECVEDSDGCLCLYDDEAQAQAVIDALNRFSCELESNESIRPTYRPIRSDLI